MNCPECGREIPGLACEPCTTRRSLEAIRQSQRHHIEEAREDRVRFFAVRRAGTSCWHLTLFGDRTHTFCGEQFLRPGYQNRTHLTWRYVQERPKDICEKCLAHVRSEDAKARKVLREEA